MKTSILFNFSVNFFVPCQASGKLLVLDQLLQKLYQSRHRVLLFAQMTHTLDILQVFPLFKSLIVGKHIIPDAQSIHPNQLLCLLNELGFS